ncbi:MAG: amidohydrolase family protein [Gemmatimonadales bacterium]|nr:amidohydrolase family protein [Gemmatimonadales bacterium]NIN10888.1 amidohydrolase family protein [Gemmatimonadales bacterium]NIR02896.1 amidohydrolase family protein [Gemmatimonadales bacterium]NIS66531.1 amidohydrolase family protein [Gemmatimonadales bacterium]
MRQVGTEDPSTQHRAPSTPCLAGLPGLVLLSLVTGCGGQPTAELVFHNSKIVTVDDDRPEASALALAGDRILAVGTLEEMEHLIDEDTKVYDLGGRTIIPGINETHIHVRDLGFQQRYAVNLEPARTIADVQQLLKDRLAQLQRDGMLGGWEYPTSGETGPWLYGLGWTQDRLVEKRMVNRHELDEVSRDVPISAERIYNGIVVNTKVFELLGIDFDDPSTHPDWFTADPPDFVAGDIIFRDPRTGLPNGVFVGARAPRLVSEAIPRQTFEQRVESLVLGLEVLASLGITAVVEAGSSMGRVTEVYEAAYESDEIPVRSIIYDGWYRSGDPGGLGEPTAIAERLDILGSPTSGDVMLRIRGAKASADGGIGSRSAAVSVPFLPIPQDPLGADNYGAFRDPDFDYRLEQFQMLANHGWEIHTHACGDAAIRQTMDVYKILMDSILRGDPDADLRWSIIHVYLPDEPQTSVVEDMAKYGVIAAINPANLYYEGDSFVRNIGPERMARHTPFKTFLDAGIRMASGSDYPNNSPDPWVGMYAMVTRRHEISGEVYGPGQRIALLEALKTFTINGAYLTYDDDVRGSLEPGKLADLVILDADLLNASEEELLAMSSSVLVTMLGGRITYQKPGFLLEESGAN